MRISPKNGNCQQCYPARTLAAGQKGQSRKVKGRKHAGKQARECIDRMLAVYGSGASSSGERVMTCQKPLPTKPAMPLITADAPVQTAHAAKLA